MLLYQGQQQFNLMHYIHVQTIKLLLSVSVKMLCLQLLHPKVALDLCILKLKPQSFIYKWTLHCSFPFYAILRCVTVRFEALRHCCAAANSQSSDQLFVSLHIMLF